MMKHAVARALVGVMAASVLVIAPAGAQEEPPPAPFACGQLFEDPAEDVDDQNLDLIGGGIAAADEASFTAEMQVTNLTTELPPGATGLVWYFQWTYGEVNYFASARYSLWTGEVAYGLGERTDTGFSTTGETEGTFNEGEQGTITIVVPHEAVGSPSVGEALTQVYAESRTGLSGPAGPGLVSQADRGPDGEAYGTDYTTGSCASEAPIEECNKKKTKAARKKCRKKQ
ncbi:MAG: hypothetical protein M3279_11740 [Actinomycetota bacterium]|nr:hypothetical protein [Actinomycetota bacterium]